MSKLLNRRLIAEFDRRLDGVGSFVAMDYQGIDAHNVYDLRTKLRAEGIRMLVVKNSLAARSLSGKGLAGAEPLFDGPVALLYGHADGAPAVARSIIAWRRAHQNLGKLKGALVDGSFVDASQVDALSKLPTRKEMLSILLSTVIAPMTQVATLLANTLAQVPNLVANHIDKLEKNLGVPADDQNNA